jgi:RND family efflux transporter MFP subunit
MHRDEPPPAPRRSMLPWILAAVGLAVVALVALRLPLPWLVPEVATERLRATDPASSQAVLTATGYTYARVRAAVGAKIIGRVVELRVDEGDRIRRGEVIAVLDSADLEAAVRRSEAELREAEARLADAQREERRQESLVAAGVGPQADLDAARTRREVAEAQVRTAFARLASAQAQLDYTVISSPVDGVVIERNVEVGEMVAPGGFTSQQSTGAIVRIADPSSLEVEADINESYIARVKLGQPAAIQVDAVPDHAYRGRLRQIVPTADRQRAVVEVKVSIDDRDERLVPDMSCTVTFLEQGSEGAGPRQQRLSVPAAAVVEEDGETVVFVVRDERAERRIVELGERTGERIEVRAGLSAGDEVVLEPPAELGDGERVRVRG